MILLSMYSCTNAGRVGVLHPHHPPYDRFQYLSHGRRQSNNENWDRSVPTILFCVCTTTSRIFEALPPGTVRPKVIVHRPRYEKLVALSITSSSQKQAAPVFLQRPAIRLKKRTCSKEAVDWGPETRRASNRSKAGSLVWRCLHNRPSCTPIHRRPMIGDDGHIGWKHADSDRTLRPSLQICCDSAAAFHI